MMVWLTFAILNQHFHLLFNATLRSIEQAGKVFHVHHMLSQTLRAAIVGVSDVLWRIAHLPQVELQVWRVGEWATV